MTTKAEHTGKPNNSKGTRDKRSATKEDKAAKRKAKAEQAAANRAANVATAGQQLTAWSTQIEDLVGGSIRAGAQTHDPYRQHLADLRTLHGVVQAKFDAFIAAGGEDESWGAFRARIGGEWAELEAGLQSLAN